MLKQMGIAVVFEKENINTATMNSEMILTVLSAFAQAESESISQNVARGKRMGYKHGKFAFPYGRIIGYRKGADGKPEIIPEQAEIIRLIFNRYLQGDSLQSIKAKLETAGALTARGNTAWSAQSIQRILQNEKYCGDVYRFCLSCYGSHCPQGVYPRAINSSRGSSVKLLFFSFIWLTPGQAGK